MNPYVDDALVVIMLLILSILARLYARIERITGEVQSLREILHVGASGASIESSPEAQDAIPK